MTLHPWIFHLFIFHFFIFGFTYHHLRIYLPLSLDLPTVVSDIPTVVSRFTYPWGIKMSGMKNQRMKNLGMKKPGMKWRGWSVTQPLEIHSILYNNSAMAEFTGNFRILNLFSKYWIQFMISVTHCWKDFSEKKNDQLTSQLQIMKILC